MQAAYTCCAPYNAAAAAFAGVKTTMAFPGNGVLKVIVAIVAEAAADEPTPIDIVPELSSELVPKFDVVGEPAPVPVVLVGVMLSPASASGADFHPGIMSVPP